MDRIVGIDLGTSTSEIAVLADGQPKVIPNHLGELITPSVVHIAVNGDILVGAEAAELVLLEPECTFMEVKRLFGSEETLFAHGAAYTTEKLQSYILRYLADCAEKYLGEPVKRAVITVPAYFNDVQRRLTVTAGELAGLEVMRIINEPTAAALDYGLAHMEDMKHILVYDFGGGTLDVTVLELFEGVVDVKASRGNNQLGGKDFDAAIVRYLTEIFRKEHSVDLAGNVRAMMRVRKAAQEAKIALSSTNKHTVQLPFLSGELAMQTELSRTQFEDLIRNMADSTGEQIKTAITDAGLSKTDIGLVLLVGGSTRIPYIADVVHRSLGIEPSSLLDPDLAVVRGAAIQGGIISGELASELVMTDVCPFTLGTDVLADTFMPRTVFDPIIPRNTTIPVSKKKTYFTVHDDQTMVDVRVYQGEYSDPKKNQLLGNFLLKGIPPAPAGTEPLEVEFAYDINGILQVEARVVSNGRAENITISTVGVEPRPAIDLSKWLEAKNAKKYRPAIRRAERIAASGSEWADELELAVQKLKEALVTESAEDIKDNYEELLELLENCADE